MNEKKRKAGPTTCFSLVRETGLEPVRCNHTPLKRARLPVPPLSHMNIAVAHHNGYYYTIFFPTCQGVFANFFIYF